MEHFRLPKNAYSFLAPKSYDVLRVSKTSADQSQAHSYTAVFLRSVQREPMRLESEAKCRWHGRLPVVSVSTSMRVAETAAAESQKWRHQLRTFITGMYCMTISSRAIDKLVLIVRSGILNQAGIANNGQKQTRSYGLFTKKISNL